MYKILLAGAVISTIMLVQARSEDKPTNNNPQLIKAFEQTKKQFAEDKKSSTLVKKSISNIPMIPVEPNIKDFPAPLPADESDQAKISDYYKKVAEAYKSEHDKSHQCVARANNALINQRTNQQLKAQRHDGVKLPNDITNHKAGHSTNDKHIPFKSSKHNPPLVHADAEALQAKRFNELKHNHDENEMKHKFYAAIAKELEQGEKNPA